MLKIKFCNSKIYKGEVFTMKLNKKIARYILKHGYEIKNYQQLCKILKEEIKTGEAKQSQQERWSLYFDYETVGHKVYITDIYDDKTVKENEKLYNENKDINAIYSRSRYRNQLIPILLHLLESNNGNPLIKTKVELAVLCGFLNIDSLHKSKYSDYIPLRNSKKISNKIYFNVDMKTSTFYEYWGEVKKNAFNSIERALKSLKDLNLIDYEYIDVGINSGNIYPLTTSEQEIYKECKDKAREELLPFYNKHTKKQKEKLEEKDFIFRYEIREEYYEILNTLVRERLEYNTVFKHYYIIFKQENFEKSIMSKRKINSTEYTDFKTKINHDFVLSLKANLDAKIKQDEICWNGFRLSCMDPNIPLKDINPKEGRLQEWAEQKYYNECEIIDLLVNYTPSTTVINLEEFKNEHIKNAINDFFETGDINTFYNSSFENSEEDYELINKMLQKP